METPTPQSQRAGAGLMLASVGFIAVVDTAAKYMTVDLHALVIVWGYFLGILLSLVVWAIAARAGRRGLLRSRRPVLQLVRSSLLVAAIAALYVGLTYLPFAEATAISFMSPLFMVPLSMALLGERVDRRRWIAVLLGLLGMLVIVRPGGGIAHWAAFMPLVTAAALATYQVTTRVLAASDRVFTTLFYTGAGGFLWSCLLVPFVWSPVSPGQWGAFAVMGMLGATAHLCLIKSLALAQASLLAPLNYTKLVWAAVLGYVVFGDIPSLNTLAGCTLIVASGLYVIRGAPGPR